jgi:hypothetical protein
MAHRLDEDPAPQYEETTDPRNPPNSVLKPSARRGALWTYVGGIVALFLIVGAALVYWSTTDQPGDLERERPDASAVGTTGAAKADPGVGGFEPAPDQKSTSQELEYKGAGERPQGPMPGLQSETPLNELGSMFEGPSKAVIGRRIDVQDVDVERATEAETFYVRDGDVRAAVIAPPRTSPLRAGQRVNVSGNVEPDGSGNLRIRATRVEVKE